LKISAYLSIIYNDEDSYLFGRICFKSKKHALKSKKHALIYLSESKLKNVA